MKLIIKLSDSPKMLEEMITRMAKKVEYSYLKAIVEIFAAKNAEIKGLKDEVQQLQVLLAVKDREEEIMEMEQR